MADEYQIPFEFPSERLSLSSGINPSYVTCPHCGTRDTLEGIDGDTVFLGDELDDYSTTAEELLYAKAGHSFSVSAHEIECTKCNNSSYVVHLELIARPEMSHDWADKYICYNEVFDEPETPFVVTLKEDIEGVPQHWQLYRVETPEGRLDRHCFGVFPMTKYFGPFVEIEYLSGENGVASCNNSHIWRDAAVLIGRVWPILTGTAAKNDDKYSLKGGIFIRRKEWICEPGSRTVVNVPHEFTFHIRQRDETSEDVRYLGLYPVIVHKPYDNVLEHYERKLAREALVVFMEVNNVFWPGSSFEIDDVIERCDICGDPIKAGDDYWSAEESGYGRFCFGCEKHCGVCPYCMEEVRGDEEHMCAEMDVVESSEVGGSSASSDDTSAESF